MKKKRIAINGLGRIGRAFVRHALLSSDMEIVAVNDLGSLENLAYLLRYDSVYRKAPFTVAVEGDALVLGGKKVRFLQEKDASKLPWKEMMIDVVVEATGVFTEYEAAHVHIDAGARHVVITAPSKVDSVMGQTLLVGINEHKESCPITSNASCTTNSASPVIAILDEALGIEKSLLTTVHPYTASQSLVDGPHKSNVREGRAAAQNIVPSTTGAAVSVTKAYTALADKFDGISLRVPVIVGAISDITFIAKRNTTVEEVNDILTEASRDARWENIFTVSTEPLVSSDVIGMEHASMAELSMTRVVGGNLVKVLAWYDNEMGYTRTLLDHIRLLKI